MTSNPTLEPQIDLLTMARVVWDLLAHGEERRDDGRWLSERTAADGLGAHACAALEAMRQRLCERGAALIDSAAITPWN